MCQRFIHACLRLFLRKHLFGIGKYDISRTKSIGTSVVFDMSGPRRMCTIIDAFRVPIHGSIRHVEFSNDRFDGGIRSRDGCGQGPMRVHQQAIDEFHLALYGLNAERAQTTDNEHIHTGQMDLPRSIPLSCDS